MTVQRAGRMFVVGIALVVVACDEPRPDDESPADVCSDPCARDASPPDADTTVNPDTPTGDPDIEIDTDAVPRDRDGDGVIDELDAFPDDITEWEDTDSDGVGDNADACPTDPADHVDSDGDGVCDASDACPEDGDDAVDRDEDGVCDTADAFPDDITEWLDTDDDGIGNNADTDDDGDGIDDEEELIYGSDCTVSNPLRADSDGDGIDDPDDPYPRDPYLEFVLRSNATGTIDLFLSNRDGTFRDPVAIGEPIEHDGRPLTYGAFQIGDFDRDGRIDFVAHSSRLEPDTPSDTRRNFYFFYRDDKEDEFLQAFIGVTDVPITGALVDADGDNFLDVARFVADTPDVSFGRIDTYLNTYSPTVSCVYSTEASDGCFFHLAASLDVSSVVGGEWVAQMAFQAVNLNPVTDGFRDLTLLTYSSGGNAATDVYSVLGNGDGTFGAPTLRFTHNADRSQAPGNSVLFADFDGDGVGDVLIGFDDDGRAGNAWTYLGDGTGGFEPTPIDAVDLNPDDVRESSGALEYLGRTSSGRTFDVDYDGRMDLLIGYDPTAYSGTDGETRLYLGNGDGTFGPDFTLVGPRSVQRHAFAIPTRLCPEYAFVVDD